MASHVQQFFKGAQGLKLKELAPYAAKYYRENLTYSKLRPQIAQGLDVSLSRMSMSCSWTMSPRIEDTHLVVPFYFSYGLKERVTRLRF